MRSLRILILLLGIGLVVALTGEPARAAPAALTMTVSNPYCMQPVIQSGACYINVGYFYASTTDSSFSRIEISIDGKVRMRMASFFENSAYLTGAMLGDGLKVACGGQNASGVPGFGRVYSVNLTGYATTGSPVTDIANVTCPFYEGKTYLPVVRR
jgi:hypothetical protein